MNKKELINLILGVTLIVSFFIGFTTIMDSSLADKGVADQWYQFDFYADHYSTGTFETPTPTPGTGTFEGTPTPIPTPETGTKVYLPLIVK